MPLTIETIYTDFRSNFKDTPNFTIDFYLEHAIFFKNIKQFSNKEELRLFIELNWQYLNATFRKDRFNETVDIVNEIQPLIEREIVRLNASDLKDDWYDGIIAFKGMATYKLRDYKTATSIFSTLVKVDPKKDNYRNWLNHSTYGKKQIIINILGITFLTIGTIVPLFKNNIPVSIRFPVLLICAIGFFSVWGYDFYIKRSLRKSII